MALSQDYCRYYETNINIKTIEIRNDAFNPNISHKRSFFKIQQNRLKYLL